MNNTKKSVLRAISLVALSVAILACTNKEESETQFFERTVPEFRAAIEDLDSPDTRVYADDNLMVLWHEDDRVSIFNKNTFNQEYKFNGETGSNSGSFSKIPSSDFVSGNELPYSVAVYPFNQKTTISNSGVLSLDLPSEQTYAEGSFGKEANVMIAATEDNLLVFRNLCGYLMFKLYGAGLAVSSISLKGNNGEVLAGKTTVTMPIGGVPELEINSNSAITELLLKTTTPVALGSSSDDYTEFWFVVPPITFSKGITLNVTLSDGSIFEKSTTGSFSITRNKRSRLSPLEVTRTPADDEIWYTSTDGEIVTPNVSAEFGANVVSNTYNNGMGIIKFDAPITTIGDRAFNECNTLKTVSHIGEGVKRIGEFAFGYCSSLTSITLPINLEVIGEGAFYNCGLKQVTIPESILFIGQGAFLQNNYNPEEGEATLIEAYYGKGASEDHKCLILEGKLLQVARGDTNTDLIVPEGVTSIASSAFFGVSYRSITLPESLLYFENESFSSMGRVSGFYGKFASADHRCLVQNGALKALARYGLSNYTVSEPITSIGTCALVQTIVNAEDNDSFVLTLPETLITLDNRAFRFSRFKTIILPASLKTIGKEAFVFSGPYLKHLTIPASVELIDDSAFRSSVLTDITFLSINPQTITDNTFSGLPSNCLLFVPEESLETYKNAQYWSDYADRIRAIPSEEDYEIRYISTTGEIVVPNNDNAFGSPIVSNTYQDGVGIMKFDAPLTTIGQSAFSGCKALKKILHIGSGVVAVDNYAFSGCSSLTEVSLPQKLISIGASAFANCSLSELSLPENVKTIGDCAFQNSLLTTVTIPESVEEIGIGAFSQDAGKMSILSYYGKGASSDHSCLVLNGKLIQVARGDEALDYIVPDGTTDIQEWAFKNVNFTSISFPESLVSCNDYFMDVRQLSGFYGKFSSADHNCLVVNDTLKAFVGKGIPQYDVTEPVTTIGYRAFSNAELDELTLPETVTTIMPSAFNSSKIKAVNLPSSLETIGNSAFAWCSNLTHLTIPASVKSIGTMAFLATKNGSGLEDITFLGNTPPSILATTFNRIYSDIPFYVPKSSVETYKTAQYWSNYANRIQAIPDQDQPDNPNSSQADNEIWYTSTDGNIVQPHNSSAFERFIESNTYENGKGVIRFNGPLFKIGNSAFLECGTLKTITHIGKGVKSIENDAFWKCNNLVAVSLPEQLESLGTYAFASCPLTEISFPNTLTSIGGQAFDGNAFTTVTIPESVTIIGDRAFRQNPGSRTISGFYGKGASADYQCLILDGRLIAVANLDTERDFVIPEGVTNIDGSVFEAAVFSSIKLPQSLLDFDDYSFFNTGNISAFYGKFATEDHHCLVKDGKLKAVACRGLLTYTVTAPITSVSAPVFKGVLLEELTLPDTVVSLENSAFSESRIKTINLPSSLNTVGDGAFRSNTNLKRLTIPASVVSLGKYVFNGQTGMDHGGLSDITFLSETPPAIQSTTFSYMYSDCPLFVPANAVQTYKAAQYWSDVADRIQAIPE